MSDPTQAIANPRILIAEDEIMLAKDLVMSLKDLGYELTGRVSSGEEAIRMVEELKPNVVLMDINLKGEMDGIQAAEIIRIRYDIPVVYLTAFAAEDVLERAQRTGPYGFLREPVSLIELKSTIETALYKHEAERRIRASEHELRLITDSLGVLLAHVDSEQRHVWANRAYGQFFGLSSSEIQGRHVRDVLGDKTYSSVRHYLRRALSGENVCFETSASGKSGEVKQLSATYVPHLAPDGTVQGVIVQAIDITERKKSDEALHRIEWLLEPQGEKSNYYDRSYGDLAQLNTKRVILDAVGQDMLRGIAQDFLVLLDTSAAIYEQNGDYALGIFSSHWCRFLDEASYQLCRTNDPTEALESGEWLCHESCWTKASKVAIERGQTVDTECHGGLRLHAIPIRAGGDIVGSINFGYGDPPTDQQKLKEIADTYDVHLDTLNELAHTYESRPRFIIDMAKNRLEWAAQFIGAMVERKKAEAEGYYLRKRLQALWDLARMEEAEYSTLCDVALRQIQQMTNSTYSFFGFLNEDETIMNLYAWSPEAMADCRVRDKTRRFSTVNAGLWAECVNLRGPFITNDYRADHPRKKGLPGGHVPLTRLISVPVIRDGRVVAIAAAANKPDDYSEEDAVQVEAFVSGVLTILDRKQTEEKYRSLVSNIPDVTWTTDSEGNTVFISPNVERIYGFSPAEISREGDRLRFGRIHPDDLRNVKEAFTGLFEHGEPFDTEYRIRRRDEQWIWIQDRAMLTYERDGRLLADGVFTDITERKEAERELQKSNDLLRAIIEAVPAAILGLDLDGNVRDLWNPAAEKMLGWSAREVMGRPLPSVPAAKQEEFRDIQDRVRSGETLGGVEVRRQRRDGTPIDYSIYASPLHDTEGRITGNIGVLVDITERKRAEEELKKHRDHLEELVKERTAELAIAKEAAESASRAKSEFLAGMSHELRTPLNAIMGYAQILRKDKELSDKQRDQLKTIQSSGEHLLRLISDILDLSRIEAQKMEVEANEFDLSDLIRAVLSTTRIKALKKNLSVRYEDGSSLPRIVKGDRKKIQQVLLNLLDNAVKYTEKGGVTLRGSGSESPVPREKESQQHLHMGTSPEGEHPLARLHKAGALCHCLFEVTDTGTGIPENQREQIFEPFKQWKFDQRSPEGIGLGLAICRRLVDLMGGTLSLESEVGKGSTFMVELDLEVGEEVKEPAGEPERTIIGYKGQRKAILIVDDNGPNLSMLVSLLKPLGFEIETTESGEKAVRIASISRPDLILLDLLMPGMDGHEVLRRIRDNERLKEVRVIGVSAAVADKARTEKFAAECDGFSSKPVEIKPLLDEIKAQLQIEWIEEEAQEGAPAISAGPSTTDAVKRAKVPSPAVLEEIIGRVDAGDYTELERILKKLLLQDAGYRGFCDTISEHSEDYDDEAILEYINNLGQDTIE